MTVADQIEELREQVRQLRAALGVARRWPDDWRLTRSETVMLGVLVARDMATKNTLVVALGLDRAERPSDKLVEVHLSRLRRKVKARGIHIRNRVGTGWFLSREDRARLREIAAAEVGE